jgi:AcrR family transcriptional regulator
LSSTREATRAAIRDAATETFGARGYRAATLEQIGAQVGITRSAVLHHFHSKADLLAAVVDPCLGALAELVAAPRGGKPRDPAQQRQVLTQLTELFLEHRGALRLLVNDAAAGAELGSDVKWAAFREQLVVQLFGPAATADDHVRVAAALGAVCQPVTNAWLDLDDGETRRELIDAAVGAVGSVARRPGATGW